MSQAVEPLPVAVRALDRLVTLRVRHAWVPIDIVGAALALLAVGLVGAGLSDYSLFIVTLVVVYAIVGSSHVLLFGAAGQASVGQAALLGIGAYTGAVVGGRWGYDLPVELLLAFVLAGIVGLGIGLPSLRIGHLHLAIATLALNAAAQQVFFIWSDLTGGGVGISAQPAAAFGQQLSALQLLYVSLGVAAVLLLVARNTLRGRAGRAFHALRTSSRAASANGVPVGIYKVGAFGLAGAMAGVAGVLYIHAVNYVSSEDFTVDLSILFLVVAIIGGQRSLWGSALGATFVVGLPEVLRGVGEYRYLIFGGVFVLVMLFFPGGFAGAVRGIAGWAGRRVGWGRREPEQAALLALPTSAVERVVDRPGLDGRARPGWDLVFEDVTIAFGGVPAIDGVSSSIIPGSVVGLVGPNGAGKTTLVNAVSGLVRMRGGRITVDGRDLRSVSLSGRARLGIARTFQNLSLYEGMTVLDHLLVGQHTVAGYGAIRQVIRSPRFLRREAGLRDHATQMLEVLDLGDYSDLVVQDLPYGVQKRVDVARALVTTPRLLLLDEPAAGLPPSEADALIDRVLVLARRWGTTVVMIEHNIDLVLRVCERIVALNFGHVIADGEPAEVRVAPQFIAAYLGA